MALPPSLARNVLTRPGDVVLTRGNAWISRAIRFMERTWGESKSRVNHVGIIVEGGPLTRCVLVEALSRVRRHRLWITYAYTGTEVAIYRPINLTRDEVERVVSEAEKYVGRQYGYLKIAAHAIDRLLGGVYLARRLANLDRYPICSWVVAQAFHKGAGKDFGCPPGQAQPDDIDDFIQANPDKYMEIIPLDTLGQ